MSKELKESKNYMVNKDVDSVINKYLSSKELLPNYFQERIFPLLKLHLLLRFDTNKDEIYEKVKDLFYDVVDSTENTLNEEIFNDSLNSSIEVFEKFINYGKYTNYQQLKEKNYLKSIKFIRRERDNFLKRNIKKFN